MVQFVAGIAKDVFPFSNRPLLGQYGLSRPARQCLHFGPESPGWTEPELNMVEGDLNNAADP